MVVNPVYELHRDEFLHLDQAKHLAWGFHSVPPFISWVSWIILQLGNGFFWIRFFPALFGALTILVVWKTIENLRGGIYAYVLAGTALLLSVLLRINILYQPNAFDILAWTLIYFCVIRYVQTERNKWLYFLAFCFAVGFLNKYNIVFCLAGLLPAILLSKHRKVFFNKHLYFAIVLALVLISPNLLWQYQNDFPVVRHMKELADTQLVHIQRSSFVKEQFFYFIGSIFILIAAFISFFKYGAFKPFRFLFIAFALTIAVFLTLKAKPYYAIGLYPIFFAFGSVYLSHILSSGWKYYLRYALFVPLLFFGYALIKTSLPIFTPAQYVERAQQKEPFSEHTWEDGKKHPISQDFADMLGWKELTHKVDSVYSQIPNKKRIFILCDNYGQAGAINYYTQQKGLVANAFNTDYDKWLNLDQKIETVIRIKTINNVDFTRDRSLFQNVDVLTRLKTPLAREKGAQIILLSGPKVDIAALLRKERAEGKLN